MNQLSIADCRLSIDATAAALTSPSGLSMGCPALDLGGTME
jgi:hypothetical protein